MPIESMTSKLQFNGFETCDGRGMGQPVDPRKGTPDPTVSLEEFKRRFLAQYIDPAFAPLATELDRISAAAYEGSRALSCNRRCTISPNHGSRS